MDINISNDDVKKIDNIFTINSNNVNNNDLIKSSVNDSVNKFLTTELQKTKLDEDFFVGYIKSDDIKGSGILISRNKLLLKGQFDGINTISDCNIKIDNMELNGTIIEGEFISGCVNYDNIKISGQFKNGLPDSSAKLEKANACYEGEWMEGKMQGLGFYKDTNIKYEGEWLNNKFHGDGTLYKDNYVYSGLWEKGQKNGQGKLTIDQNEYYVEYKNDIELSKINYSEKRIKDLENIINTFKNEKSQNVNIIKGLENDIMEYSNKLKKVENEKKEIEEKFLCKICFKNMPNVILKPCSHQAICDGCEVTLRASLHGKKCPICRKKYNDLIRIYIA